MKGVISIFIILSLCLFHLNESHNAKHPKYPPKPGTKCMDARKAVMHQRRRHNLHYDTPPCDSNGNYKKVQCERDFGCWCVLPISGIEVPGTWKTYANREEVNCEVKPPHLHPDFPPKKGLDCETALSIVLYERELGRKDYPLPNCDDNGLYKSVKCVTKRKKRVCWCVDPHVGKKIRKTKEKNVKESQMKCGGRIKDYKFPPKLATRCEFAEKAYKIQMKKHPKKSAQRPSCDDEGNYKEVQCLSKPKKSCWCVLPNSGIKVPDSQKNGILEKDMKCAYRDRPYPDPKPPKTGQNRHCLKVLEIAIYEGELGLVDHHYPRCDNAGNYHREQCSLWPEFVCWCVKRKSGKEIDGTLQRGENILECGKGKKDKKKNNKKNIG